MNIATTRGQGKTMSLPNILTYARIAAIPVVVGCVFAQSILDGPLWLRWVALAVFIAAGVTDYLDGYYARMWDQQSAFGRMLDPIADKLLVATTLLLLASDNTVGEWSLIAAIIILTPILLPLVKALGIDAEHFGIVMIVNLAIGMVTPPVGVNLFVVRFFLGFLNRAFDGRGRWCLSDRLF